MIMLKFLVLLFVSFGFAASNNLDTAFKNYQSGDFDSSKTLMEEALKSNPHDSYLIYNLGLTEYKRGKVGMAIALWRKALSINPRLTSARNALHFAISQMQTKPLASHVDSSLDWIEKMITDHVSVNVIWPLLLIVCVLFFKNLFQFLAARKKAFLNDEAAPVLPVAIISYGVLLVIFILLSIVSISDLTQEHATVIATTAAVKTGPADDNTTLFEIPEGTELIIDDKQGPWYKIEDPTGRVGWISGDSVYMTSEKYL
jgi:tetratricopeptide (TPR) repeat protein